MDLLRDDPEWAERAAECAAKCRDISELLCDSSRARSPSADLRAAYHDACHLQHAPGVRYQPRNLLADSTAGTFGVPQAAICCGSARVYNLVEADTANQLGDREGEPLLSTTAPWSCPRIPAAWCRLPLACSAQESVFR